MKVNLMVGHTVIHDIKAVQFEIITEGYKYVKVTGYTTYAVLSTTIRLYADGLVYDKIDKILNTIMQYMPKPTTLGSNQVNIRVNNDLSIDIVINDRVVKE